MWISASYLQQRIMQYLYRVQGLFTGTVFHLVTAAGARRCNDRFCSGIAHRREQYHFPDLHGKIIVLFLIAERTCHAAAAGRDHLYGILRW